MVNFKESYLIPKKMFETKIEGKKLNKMMGQELGNMADDVQLGLLDYNRKFPTEKGQENKRQEVNDAMDTQIKEMLNSIRDSAKRKTGEKILRFMADETGGEISWTDTYKVKLDEEILWDTDMRDIIRKLVGEINDPEGEAKKIEQKLRILEIDENLLLFYQGKKQEDSLGQETDILPLTVTPGARHRKVLNQTFYDNITKNFSKKMPWNEDEAVLDEIEAWGKKREAWEEYTGDESHEADTASLFPEFASTPLQRSLGTKRKKTPRVEGMRKIRSVETKEGQKVQRSQRQKTAKGTNTRTHRMATRKWQPYRSYTYHPTK